MRLCLRRSGLFRVASLLLVAVSKPSFQFARKFCEEGAIKARSTALSSESAPQDAGLVAQE